MRSPDKETRKHAEDRKETPKRTDTKAAATATDPNRLPPADAAAPEPDALMDDKVNVSETEAGDLENATNDLSSDESQVSDLLDDTDTDGDALNEGPDEQDLFDTGEDLDISEETLFPDEDPDSDDN